ncbi:MAG TPA: hypothetical protein VMS16_08005 [Mycobacterium sp.]|nr:hypothetical protein [Mycobacterium sp.]
MTRRSPVVWPGTGRAGLALLAVLAAALAYPWHSARRCATPRWTKTR